MIKKTVTKIYFVFGLLFLLIAIVGIALPILPTTPFILLAIYFFDKSSKKFHSWCLRVPGFGDRIEEWKNHKVIRKSAKIQSIFIISLSAGFIIYKQSLMIEVKLVTLLILFIVVVFIVTRSSERKA